MFHGSISPHIAKGLKVLKSRIEKAKIPSSSLDESINIATWNIREFGRMRNRKRRTQAAIHYIAEILNQFDVIAVTELRDDLTDLSRVMKVLGPYWKVVFSDYLTDRGGNRERMAFLYDMRAAVFTGLAAEADPPRKKDRKTGAYLPTLTWYRSPYMASFRAGSFDFVMLAVHIVWGTGGLKGRVPELKELANWVHKRTREKGVVDKDFIVLGDFNIPKVDDAAFDAVTSKGLVIPKKLRGTGHGSNLRKDKRYDQILFYPRIEDNFTDKAGTLDFFDDDWRALFPKDEYPNMDKTEFTYQLSDHLPLWAQLNVGTDDALLEQIIGRARR